jgi:two-component system NtrC family sensor kinase
VVIEIADNGPGIPKEILDKIFDPFFTTKSPQEGTGLGLSISYSIMEKLGGRISVASEENEGTRFTITVPAK